MKQEKEQAYQEKMQIKLKYDGLLEEIRVILLDRSKLEQQLTNELQERMEQRQRSKDDLHKYQLQISEVNQKLVDTQARLVLLQSQIHLVLLLLLLLRESSKKIPPHETSCNKDLH